MACSSKRMEIKSIDDIFGKQKKERTSKKKSHSNSYAPSPISKDLIRSESAPTESQSLSLPPLPRIQQKRKVKEQPRYLMPKAVPKSECDVIARARSLVSAADQIQQQLLNPTNDPIYMRNEHRLAAKAKARDFKDESKQSAMRSLAAKELRADRVAHQRQFEKQLSRDMNVYRKDIKNATFAVQRTLATDPILLRHQKEKEKQARNKRRERHEGGGKEEEVSLSNSHKGSQFCQSEFDSGAHSKEGDLAIKRARELTALALAQL
mmetsp:Transcript_6652/g.8618  ORF Transcript_6652/g.8618 Transcript_6652/m.8618 type:complete len:265 (-) Transcript_6652:507-1301(-)